MQHLVQNVLLDPGVSVSNITLNGNPLQIGYFSNGIPSIPLDTGIVLCTDQVNILDVNNTQPLTTNFSSGGSMDLLSIANSVPPLIGQNFSVSSVNDLVELEFDFVPLGDTVIFRYIFGSNEYPQYINSTYNDVFAFLISGPGITGPYSSPPGFPGGAKNIAVVPNSNNLPVTISSVNNFLNNLYYIDNPSFNGINLRGFTKRLRAKALVQCGEVYHVKISIADGSDQYLHSAVLLEGISSSDQLLSLAHTSTNINSAGNGVFYEGCANSNVVVIRGGDLSVGMNVVLDYAGVALSGIDYSVMTDTIQFAPGQDTLFIPFDVYADGIYESPEALLVNAYVLSNSCQTPVSMTLMLDESSISSFLTSQPSSCLVANGQAMINSIGGIAPYQYLWSTGSTSNSIQAVNNGIYYVSITDAIGCSAVDSIQIGVPAFQVSTTYVNETCQGDCNGVISFQVSGGTAPFEYSIDGGINYTTNPFYNQLCSGSYIWSIRDAYGCTTQDSLDILQGLPNQNLSIQSIGVLCDVSPGIILQTNIPGGTFVGSGIINANTGEFSPSLAGVGTHVVQYYLSNNPCSDTAQIQIQVSNQVQISLSNQIICDSMLTHTLPSVPTGGVWQGSGIIDATTGLLDVSMLSAGTHTYTYYLSQPCGDTASMQLQVLHNEKPILTIPNSMCLDHTPVTLMSSISGGLWLSTGLTSQNPPVFSPSIAGVGHHTVTYTNLDLCQAVSMAEIVVSPVPNAQITALPSSGCLPLEVFFSQNDTSVTKIDWYLDNQWIANSQTWSHMFNKEAVHQVYAEVQNNVGCNQNVRLNPDVEVYGLPIADFRYEILEGTYKAAFTDQSVDAQTYVWSLNGSYAKEMVPVFDFKDTGVYMICLDVASTHSCLDSTCKIIEIKSPFFEAYVPNTFTPNLDVDNELFYPVLTDDQVQDYEFRIYTRWGEVVFVGTEPMQGWDGLHNGELSPQGVYAWDLSFLHIKDDKYYRKTGSVHLIR